MLPPYKQTVLGKQRQHHKKSSFYRSDTLEMETMKFTFCAISQHASQATYILTNAGDKCETCALPRALHKPRWAQSNSVSLADYTLVHIIETPLSEGQRGMMAGGQSGPAD